MALSKILPASQEQYAGARNLIINGGCTISQRGASFADLSGYGLDRFQVGSSDDGAVTVTQDTTVPSGEGFKNSMKFDVTTADTSLGAAQFYQFFQKIEGQNVAHLMWGTSNAKSVTLSFWCRSNKTGTYNVNFMNNAADRFNPNDFTISSANTWEKKTITVSGDTTGTWLTTNGIGLYVIWNLALGSNFDDGTNGTWGSGDYGTGNNVNWLDSTSNEFYITGVQLEVGEQDTPFEHRSYADELLKCYRYYYKTEASLGADQIIGSGHISGSTLADIFIPFLVPMRDYPTALEQSGTASDYKIQRAQGQVTCTAVPTFNTAHSTGGNIRCTVSGGLSTGDGVRFRFGSTDSFLAWDTEL